jgi:hypothetical protein
MSAVKQNGKLLNISLLAAVYITGIIGGAIIFATGRVPIANFPVVQNFTTDITNIHSFFEALIVNFTPVFLLLLLIFLLGFGSIFSVFIPFVLLYQGLKTGLILASIYTDFEAQNILKTLIIIIPFAVFSVLVMIIACREAMRMSVTIFKVTVSCGYLPVDYKLYINKFIILTAILLAGTFIDTLIGNIFVKIL